MGKGPAIELQGSSLPPRRFASTRFRTPASAASTSRRSRVLVCLILSATLLTSSLRPQQSATPARHETRLTGPGNSRAAAVRSRTFLSQRLPALGQSPAAALLRARAQHLAMQRATPAGGGANLAAPWLPLGPSSVTTSTYNDLTGRITAIAPDPNDPTGNTVYLGTTGGGVWKSTNAAGPLSSVTFTPLTDTLPIFSANAGTGILPSLSIGAVAIQTGLNPIVLAGTGDPNDATDSYYGEGILRSTDRGLTWTLVQGSHDGANGNHSFTGLATAALTFSTATPTLAVAAFTTSPQSAIVDAAGNTSIPGLYYSIDAGQTWAMATVFDGAQIVQQPQPLGTGQVGNAVTSVVWDAMRGQFFAAIRSHGYYASPDGATWTRLAVQPGTALTSANCPVGTNGVGAPSCPIFRGALAVQPATGDLYALTVDLNDADQGLWQDLCTLTAGTCATPAPTFANRIDNAALDNSPSDPTIAQGGYDLTLSAAPAAANSTLLYAGTIDLYRCAISANESACSLRNTTNILDGCDAPARVAPAQHALASITQSTNIPVLYLGNDGGLWRSLDGVAETGAVCSTTDASHFDNLNPAIGTGGSLAEVIGFAEDPTTADTLIAGLGANGSAATSAASELTPWPQLSAGEGGLPSIDPSTPTNWFLAIGAGVNLKSCTLGILCAPADFDPPATIGEAQVSGDAALLDAPTLLDPAFTTNVIVGTCRVWRGTAADSATWSASNAISPAFDGSSPICTANSARIRSLAAGGPPSTSSNPQSSGSNVLYAGIAGQLDGGATLPGHLFVTTTANLPAPTWTDTELSPVSNDTANSHLFNPGLFDISSLAADPHDLTGATVYATIMGFGVPHLYRSTDFGAHWLNLSANLPDAPANAILVDPNDANTVYIALDTGVYVTQAITTCPSANCWSVLGTSLPNSPVIALAAAPNLPTGDGRRGLLRASTYGRGLWQTPLLTAVSLAQPAITLSVSSIDFAAQQVGTQSPAQTLTIASSGNAPVTFGTPAITGDFAETDNCAGQTIAVSATCSVQVVFAPAAIGARSGQLTLYANISGGGQVTVPLTGTGTAPASIVLTPLTLTFAATIVNQPTAAQDITISNTGGNPATLQVAVITGADPGDFALTANTCGTMLPPSTGCTVAIAFTPTASGSRTATFSITDNVGTQTATLTGTGNAPATDTLSPLSLTFAQQQIGTISPTQQVTLTNAGDVALTLIAASITSGDFTVTNACGNSLAAHATCAFDVSFAPIASGVRSGTLTVTDQFRTQTVALNGTGIAPPGVSLTPISLSFPATGVGLTALPQILTLTNNGGLPLALASIAASPDFTLAASTCGTTLPAASACTLTIVFAPTAAGPVSGTLTLTDNAMPATQAAVLTGVGIDFTLASNGPTSVTLPGSGGSGTYPLLLTSLTGLSGNVAIACSGVPANTTCNVLPAVAPLGGTSTIAVTVETAVAPNPAIAARRQSSAFGPSPLLVALLLPVAWLFRKSRRRAPHLAALALIFFLSNMLTGCGADRIIPLSTGNPITNNPTPKGTYTLTVTGSAAGITHTVTLTLIVQ
jgi:hypothetical protein